MKVYYSCIHEERNKKPLHSVGYKLCKECYKELEKEIIQNAQLEADELFKFNYKK